MELVAPAGSGEKARFAWLYGADSVYMGLDGFSLRAHAETSLLESLKATAAVKGNKKLYLAVNMFFHDTDLDRLKSVLPQLNDVDFDGFIVSDLGAFSLIKNRFPDRDFHLSTQANCLNTEAAKTYRDLGFRRIIPGRELSLENIRDIKRNVPDLELEVFVHGAMCLAYSGRCFLSAYMADRSSNKGDCAHSCRWRYLLLKEESRPGESYPVIEGDGYTTILSSRDLCMIDHLKELKDSGVHAVKIEGRMKSVYYTAVVARAYRKALDALDGREPPGLEDYKNELHNISHREYSTGFYFDSREIETPTRESYLQEYRLLGTVLGVTAEGLAEIDVRNSFSKNRSIQYIGPHVPFIDDSGFVIFNEKMEETDKALHGKRHFLKTDKPLKTGFIIRGRLN